MPSVTTQLKLAFGLSVAYVLGMAATYTIAGDRCVAGPAEAAR